MYPVLVVRKPWPPLATADDSRTIVFVARTREGARDWINAQAGQHFGPDCYEIYVSLTELEEAEDTHHAERAFRDTD